MTAQGPQILFMLLLWQDTILPPIGTISCLMSGKFSLKISSSFSIGNMDSFRTLTKQSNRPDSWHHANGPLLTYLAACPGDSCEGFDGSGDVWFKIDQLGLLPTATDLRGPWWQRELVLADGTAQEGYTVTIPKNLKPGNYLIRTELIMMASRPPQIYPECAQITVTGDGTELPGEEYLVSFPGAYADSGKTIACFMK